MHRRQPSTQPRARSSDLPRPDTAQGTALDGLMKLEGAAPEDLIKSEQCERSYSLKTCTVRRWKTKIHITTAAATSSPNTFGSGHAFRGLAEMTL